MREPRTDLLLRVNGHGDHLPGRRMNELSVTTLPGSLLDVASGLQAADQLAPGHSVDPT